MTVSENNRSRATSQKSYFYVVTTNKKGRRVVVGPYVSHEKAEVDASKSEYDSEVVKLPTKNLSRATQMIKGKDYSELGDINRSTEFVNHNAKTKTGENMNGDKKEHGKPKGSRDFEQLLDQKMKQLDI